MKKTLLIASLLACFSAVPAFASDAPPSDDMNTTEVQVSKEEKNMLQFDAEAVKKAMREDGRTDDGTFDRAINNYRKMDVRMQPILDAYLKNKILSDQAIEGITIKKVMKKYEEDFWGSLFIMEKCIHEPNGAENLDRMGLIIDDWDSEKKQP